MKFLCDVHISFRIVRHIEYLGHECIHVNEILDKWNTKDKDICIYADKNDLIVLTKDADFRNSFLIRGTPNKLVKINLGNISTNALIEVISGNIEAMKLLALKGAFMIEIDQNSATYIRNP